VLAAAATARLLWERRKALNMSDERFWLVADAMPDAAFDAEFIYKSLEDEEEISSTKADQGLACVLKHLPHAVAFRERVKIFQAIITSQQDRLERIGFRSPWAQDEHRVRRTNLLQDGFEVFNSKSGQNLKDRVRIKFIREDDTEEAGVDGGGLFKEFLHLWVRELTNPERYHFLQLPGGLLCPRALKRDDAVYFSLGKAVGKGLFECILSETRFSEVFLARVLGRPWSVDELEELDPELHRHLLALIAMKMKMITLQLILLLCRRCRRCHCPVLTSRFIVLLLRGKGEEPVTWWSLAHQ
jgi:hypothetical protein